MRLLVYVALTYPGPTPDESSVFANAMTLLLGILGSVSVLVLIYAGIRLIYSRGNPDAIAKLRSTLLYAAIGLFVAIAAGSIIGLVLERI